MGRPTFRALSLFRCSREFCRNYGYTYDPCVVRTEAPSERPDDTSEGVGRLPGRQDDEHGEEGLHELGCVLVVLHIKTYTIRHAVESRAARSYARMRARTHTIGPTYTPRGDISYVSTSLGSSHLVPSSAMVSYSATQSAP